MSCLATGIGTLSYQWEKYQKSNNTWIKFFHKNINATSPYLIFSEVIEEDEGLYHCIVANSDGWILSDNATVTVYGEYF